MSSLITSALILLATFFLLPALAPLPKCVLNAVVFLVVISLLVELPHDVKYYWKMRAHNDLALMFLTFALTIAYNIEVGVLVSFVVSLLMVVRRSSKVRISILGRVPGTNKWSAISEDPDAQELPSWTGVLVIAIRESLDFANTAQLKERLRRLELFGHEPHHPSERPRRSKARTLGFDMGDVVSIDAAAVQIFLELLETYKARGVTLFLTRVHLHPSVATSLSRSGVIDQVIGLGRVFDSLEEADRVMDLSISGSGSGGPGPGGPHRTATASTPPNYDMRFEDYEVGNGGSRASLREGGEAEAARRRVDMWDAPNAWLLGVNRDADVSDDGAGAGLGQGTFSPGFSSHDTYYTGHEGEVTPPGQRSHDSVDPNDHPYVSSHQ